MTNTNRTTDRSRRRFLRSTGLLAGTIALGGVAVGPVTADASNSPALPGRVYADDRLFATRDATDLPPPSDGNEHSFDEIYVFQGDSAEGQFPVAEAAPGEQDFNGGRWSVTVVEWTTDPVLVTSDDDIHAREAAGEISVVAEGARYFECPLVQLRS